MTTFSDLNHKPHPRWPGTQARVTFPNGYGASVIRSPNSYGGSEGLYELAVVGPDGELDYSTSITSDSTSITSDVLGHLTEQDVTDTFALIEALPARDVARLPQPMRHPTAWER